MGKSTPPELLQFLESYQPPIRDVALGLRATVIEEMAPCHEYIFWMRSKVVMLYGSSERAIDDNICSIGVFARHVDLAFKRGADLDDPAGILEGMGKSMRHIKVKVPRDLDRAEIRAFLRQSRKNAGLKRVPGAARRVMTRVKPGRPAAGPDRPRLF